MNTTKITSDAEVKLILGSTNASDALVSIHNQLSTNVLCDLLQMNNLATHNIVKEEIDVSGCGSILEFRDFPVDTTTIELYNYLNTRIDSDVEYRDDSHSEQLIHLVNSAGNKVSLGYKTGQVLANYTGGYTVQDSIALTANPSDGETFIVDVVGTQTTYTIKDTPSATTDIQKGSTKEDTATNIASKVVGTVTGATVTFPLGMDFVSSVFSASFSEKNIPEELKYIVALIAGGSISNAERAGGVVSYKLGQKSVNFRNANEAQEAKKILEIYLSKYTPIIILS